MCGWLSDLNAFLTRKLLMFLWRLSETRGAHGKGKMCLVIAKNFEAFENDIFYCKVLWMVVEGEWNSVGFFVL